MMSLIEINKAVNKALEKNLLDTDLKIPIVAADLEEPIQRPSIKVLCESMKSGKFNSRCKERTLIYRIVFFPKSRIKYKMEILQMQEIIEDCFIEGIQNKNIYFTVSEVESDIIDGVLVSSFELYAIEELPDNDNSELIEDIQYK